MCSEPVTLGGGLTSVNGCASGRVGPEQPFASQCAYHFASIAAGSKVLAECRCRHLGAGLCQPSPRPQGNAALQRLAAPRICPHSSAPCANGPISPCRKRAAAPPSCCKARWLVSSVGLLDRKLREFTRAGAARRPVDSRRHRHRRRVDRVRASPTSTAREITGASEQARKLIETVRENASTAPIEPPRAPAVRARRRRHRRARWSTSGTAWCGSSASSARSSWRSGRVILPPPALPLSRAGPPVRAGRRLRARRSSG